jgi:hypothetical protein
MSRPREGAQHFGMHWCSLRRKQVWKRVVTMVAAMPSQAYRSNLGGLGARPQPRCRSVQQGAIARGSRGAQQDQHQTVRRVSLLHVHLLSARVGDVIKTYRRQNGEDFERERNERARRTL